MLRFLTIRVFQALIVILVMSMVVYGLIGLMPGDPIDLMVAANPDLTPADGARLKALYGLDLPLHERYFNWLAAALQGDWGYSRIHAVPVMDVLLPRLANTLWLLVTVLVLAVLIALPIGVFAARHARSTADHAINLVCFAGVSIPVFWLALMLILLFAVVLGWLPAGGMRTPGEGGLFDRVEHLVLPVLTLTIASVASHTRYIRAAMQTELTHDYIRTARAKGVGEGKLAWRHALPNALIPVVTIIGLEFGNLFSGALITETMFSYLGMGKLTYDSIMGNDYNVALVALLLATGTTLAGNFLADLAYAALDPRITFGEMRV